MKFRTCPHCGYHYSKTEYFKIRFCQTFHLSWSCQSCHTELKSNVKARVVSIVLFLTLAGLFTYSLVKVNLHYRFIIGILPLVIFFLVYLLYSVDILDRK